MQNNYESSTEGLKGWFARNRWTVTLTGVILVVLICVQFFCNGFFETRVTPPPLTFDSMTGAGVSDSLGNNDRQINPGERVKVRLRLTNVGAQALSGFDMVLSTQDRGVEIIDDNVHYTLMGLGQTVWSADPFEFKLDSNFVSDCVVFRARIVNATLAGFVGDAFALSEGSDDEVVIPLDVISNYRLCVAACALQQSASTTGDDILTIDVRVCNASGGPLGLPSLRIDSLEVRMCDTPSTQFNVVRVSDLAGATVGLDSLLFTADLQGTECRKPNDPTKTTSGTGTFKFKAVLPPLSGTICVRFTALLYENHTMLVSRPSIGAETIVLPAPIVVENDTNK